MCLVPLFYQPKYQQNSEKMKRFINFILNPFDTNVYLDIFAMVLLLTNLIHLAEYFPIIFFFDPILYNELLRLNFKL